MKTRNPHIYQRAKDIFESLALKDDAVIQMDYSEKSLFRKHLSELIKRKNSSFRYASRYDFSKQVLTVTRLT